MGQGASSPPTPKPQPHADSNDTAQWLQQNGTRAIHTAKIYWSQQERTTRIRDRQRKDGDQSRRPFT